MCISDILDDILVVLVMITENTFKAVSKEGLKESIGISSRS